MNSYVSPVAINDLLHKLSTL